MSDNYYENEVRLTGDVENKPHYFRSKTGLPGAAFTLITKKSWFNTNTNQKEQRVHKHSIFVRSNETQFVLDEVAPGCVVRVKGSLEYYVDKKGRISASVMADKVTLLFENDVTASPSGETGTQQP